MNTGPLLFFGIFLTLASSFYGFLMMPYIKMGSQQVTEIKETGQLYPVGHTGLAAEGADVYRSLGCAECHTRQVRSKNLGGDIARGWGDRRSVAQDYLKDYPVLLGHLRVGPDLANAGFRYTNETEVLKLLYKPESMKQGAMPAYPFLFERTRLKGGQQPSPSALKIEGEPVDLEIVPTDRARALAAYILSLRANVNIFEAPLPVQPKPAGEDTNAVPAGSQSAPGAPTAAPTAAPSANPAK